MKSSSKHSRLWTEAFLEVLQRVTNLLLHSSWWCACHTFHHGARCTVLSLSCVCEAPLSRAVVIDDL